MSRSEWVVSHSERKEEIRKWKRDLGPSLIPLVSHLFSLTSSSSFTSSSSSFSKHNDSYTNSRTPQQIRKSDEFPYTAFPSHNDFPSSFFRLLLSFCSFILLLSPPQFVHILTATCTATFLCVSFKWKRHVCCPIRHSRASSSPHLDFLLLMKAQHHCLTNE